MENNMNFGQILEKIRCKNCGFDIYITPLQDKVLCNHCETINDLKMDFNIANLEENSMKSSVESSKFETSTVNHVLNISIKDFNEIKEGIRNFELIKNDRDYKVGNTLILKEIEMGNYTGKTVHKKITYVHKGGSNGLDKDYVILGLN